MNLLLIHSERERERERVTGCGDAAVVIDEDDIDKRPWVATIVLNKSFSILRVKHPIRPVPRQLAIRAEL